MPSNQKQTSNDQSGAARNNPCPWNLGELIDFEFALYRDRDAKWEELEARDQKLYDASQTSLGPSRSLRYWLANLKRANCQANFPGKAIDQSLRGSRSILAIFCFLSGLALGFKLLQYDGTQPVNVSAFLGLIVLAQIFLLAVSLVFLVGTTTNFQIVWNPELRFGRFLLNKTARLVAILASKGATGETHNELSAFWGRLRARSKLYRPQIRWYLFRSAQELPIAFNIGIAIAIAFIVSFSDRAFGWQTTLDVSPTQVHSFLTAIALPWSWISGGDFAIPSLEAVSGSHIVLKEGILALSTADLVSWWPFLLLASITYGLAPRCLLAIFSHWRYKRSFENIRFQDAESIRALDRLSPKLGAFHEAESLASPDSSPCDTDFGTETKSRPNETPNETELPIFVSSFLLQNRAFDTLTKKIRSSISPTEALPSPFEINSGLLANPTQLADSLNLQKKAVCFVFEAWLPPLEETKQLLETARSCIRENAPVFILLSHDANTKPEAVDSYQQNWKRFSERLSDPYLIVKALDS